jgi:hypothetical protein
MIVQFKPSREAIKKIERLILEDDESAEVDGNVSSLRVWDSSNLFVCHNCPDGKTVLANCILYPMRNEYLPIVQWIVCPHQPNGIDGNIIIYIKNVKKRAE